MKHLCHHPTFCEKPVPPQLLACKRHWFMLPEAIRKLIWRTYRPSQEVDKRPSREYLDAFKQAEDYWKKQLAETTTVSDFPLFDAGAEQ